MPDQVSLLGWAISWCQKTVSGVTTQNTTLPRLYTDPGKIFEILYDETVEYGLYYQVQRGAYNIRPCIQAELKVDGVRDRIFFTNIFNDRNIDPRNPYVEIPYGPEQMVQTGKLYWPSNAKTYHAPGVHTLIVSLGAKKSGQAAGTPPAWNPASLSIKIDVTGIIPKT